MFVTFVSSVVLVFSIYDMRVVSQVLHKHNTLNPCNYDEHNTIIRNKLKNTPAWSNVEYYIHPYNNDADGNAEVCYLVTKPTSSGLTNAQADQLCADADGQLMSFGNGEELKSIQSFLSMVLKKNFKSPEVIASTDPSDLPYGERRWVISPIFHPKIGRHGFKYKGAYAVINVTSLSAVKWNWRLIPSWIQLARDYRKTNEPFCFVLTTKPDRRDRFKVEVRREECNDTALVDHFSGTPGNANVKVSQGRGVICEYRRGGGIPKPVEMMAYNALKLNPDILDNKSRCYGDHSNIILFYAYSAPGHFSMRERIRNTWGSVKMVKGKEMRIVFFIGDLSGYNQKYYQGILHESRTHGDIVQDLSYIDSYKNLPLKGISAIQWVAKYCPALYKVIKIDDDTLINPFQLVKFLSEQNKTTISDELICKMTRGVGPIRMRASKYFVSPEQYAEETYPEYCQGYGYILPPNYIPKVLERLHETKLIPMEDVYFTGIIREKANVKYYNLPGSHANQFVDKAHENETIAERLSKRPELIIVGHVQEDSRAEVFWDLIKPNSIMEQSVKIKRVEGRNYKVIKTKGKRRAGETEMKIVSERIIIGL